jgi:hypothetical protein
MRDYSEGKIASIVTNKLPQLEFKEPRAPEKIRISKEKMLTNDKEKKLTTFNQSMLLFMSLNAQLHTLISMHRIT